jgi:hypothetical protein
MTQHIHHDRENDEVFAQSQADESAETPIVASKAERTPTGQDQQDHREHQDHQERAEAPDETTANSGSGRTKRSQNASNGQRTAKSRAGGVSRGKRTNADGIIELPVQQPVEQADVQDVQQEEAAEDAVICELESQGFTADEAIRLIHVSDRVANSGEVREAEAIIRRLRFNRWLFEQGKLNEFSA